MFTLSIMICETRNMWWIHVSRVTKYIAVGQDSRRFANDILNCIFLTENHFITTKLSPEYIPIGTIGNTLSSA